MPLILSAGVWQWNSKYFSPFMLIYIVVLTAARHWPPGENFLRIKPVIVKFSRVFGRNTEMRNAFRRVGEYVPVNNYHHPDPTHTHEP